MTESESESKEGKKIKAFCFLELLSSRSLPPHSHKFIFFSRTKLLFLLVAFYKLCSSVNVAFVVFFCVAKHFCIRRKSRVTLCALVMESKRFGIKWI